MSTYHKPAKGTSKPAQAMARAKSLRIVRAAAAPLKPWHKECCEGLLAQFRMGLNADAEAASRLHAAIFMPHITGISVVGQHLLRPDEIRSVAVFADMAEITWNDGDMKRIPLRELLGEAAATNATPRSL